MRKSQRDKLLLSALGKAQKESNRAKYKCLLPECKDDSIKSHSQQQSHQLVSISENSNVYSVQKNIYQSFKQALGIGNITNTDTLKKTPIGEASQFKGYCNTHDTEIFLPIENGNLNVKLQEHNYLLFLRCFSHEYANKRTAHDRSKVILKKVESLFSDGGIRQYQETIDALKAFMEIDAPYYLNKLFEIQESKNYSEVKYSSFVIPKNIGISLSTCFSPLREKHLEWSQKNYDSVQPTVAFSIIPEKDKTSVSFSWLSKFDHFCAEFSEINIDTVGLIEKLNSYLVTESEDFCIRPSMWEKLSSSDRKFISQAMRERDSAQRSQEIPQLIKI